MKRGMLVFALVLAAAPFAAMPAEAAQGSVNVAPALDGVGVCWDLGPHGGIYLCDKPNPGLVGLG